MATLFTVDLEEGDLTDFDSTSGTGLSAIAPGLVASVWCMNVAISNVTDQYGQISAASNESRIRVLFGLDTRGIVIGSGDEFTVLLVRDDSSNDVFHVELGYDSSTGYRVRPGIQTDGTVWSNGTWVSITDNEHTIEVDWQQASGVGANDGSIELWIDTYGTDLGDAFGSADSSVTSVDNDTLSARVFRLGAPDGLDAGTSGTIRVDHLVANDDGVEIGHPGRRAFPGAEGAGMFSVGGRGGTIIKVTNTDNSGTGSLRTALTTSGARIVVFEIDGNIDLSSDIIVHYPYLTVLGQTAPGDGVCVRDASVRIGTHDVIIQYMRFRPGDDNAQSPDDLDALDFLNDPSSSTDSDAMVFNVIVDHCSISWAIDENIAFYNLAPTNNYIQNVTVQWCIISHGLSNAGHSGGEHSMGLLFGGTSVLGCRNFSIHHNLFCHNGRRNPRCAHSTEFEIVNNVMHDCPNYTMVTDDTIANFSFIGNRIGSQGNDYAVLVEPDVGTEDPADYFDHQIYVSDNDEGNYYSSDDWEVVGKGWGATEGADGLFPAAWETGTRTHVANSLLQTTGPAGRIAAYNAILGSVGCFPRDSYDDSIITDVEENNTGLIDSQTEVGGWPSLSSGSAGTDTDSDGMPNTWETAWGTNPNVADDDQYDLWGDSYTNIEVYGWDEGLPPVIVVVVVMI